MKKDLIQTTKVIILALVLTMGINLVFASTWTPPTAAPTGNNTDTPINVGTTNQTKQAGLGLYALSVYGLSFFEDVVGIGNSTTNTGLLLDVEGKVGATEYCDQNGANCTAAADLGGGISGTIYQVTNSYSVDRVGTLTTQPTTQTRQCGTSAYNDDPCYYSCTGGCFEYDYMGLGACDNRFTAITCSNTEF